MARNISIFALCALFFSQSVLAQVMNSGSYSIQSDSINFGGGQSSSTNYRSESTFGEVATGESQSTSFALRAGYQQMQEVYLAIAAISDVTLTPTIDGAIGGVANGSATVTVTTDNKSGYELYIKASSSPALVSGVNSFADYTPIGVNPDFTFSVLAVNSEFAFSPEGNDIVQKYKDDGSTCNAGSLDTTLACWGPLTTGNELISSRTSGNHPSGTATVLRFRAEAGSTSFQSAGIYVATTTVTAIPL
jgi:hypothetical protein